MIRPVFGDSLIVASTPYVSNQHSDFSIYPNPSGDFITLRGIDKQLSHSYEILDLFGRKISEGICNEKMIDIKMLESGLYHLIIRHRTEILSSGKFVVAK
jgi:hypothetical protein